MSELQRLKRRLFKQEASEQEQVYNLCSVMEIVGGYEQLMKLPIPALNQVLKYLEFLEKQNKKSMPNLPHIRKPHK